MEEHLTYVKLLEFLNTYIPKLKVNFNHSDFELLDLAIELADQEIERLSIGTIIRYQILDIIGALCELHLEKDLPKFKYTIERLEFVQSELERVVIKLPFSFWW